MLNALDALGRAGCPQPAVDRIENRISQVVRSSLGERMTRAGHPYLETGKDSLRSQFATSKGGSIADAMASHPYQSRKTDASPTRPYLTRHSREGEAVGGWEHREAARQLGQHAVLPLPSRPFINSVLDSVLNAVIDSALHSYNILSLYCLGFARFSGLGKMGL